LLKDPANYQGFDPGLVGRRHRIVIGKHSGARAVQCVMADLGQFLSEETARKLLNRVQSFVSAEKHSPSDAELLSMLGACE
jgi:homocitrate synthase NifV